MSNYNYLQTFGKITRLYTVLFAVALTVTPLSNAQTCTGHCTTMYIYCNMGAGPSSQMPVPGQSCGARLQACDARCSQRPTKEDLNARPRSFRECVHHCATMAIYSRGQGVLACDAMCH
jgi:hypothetical protein